MFCTKSKIIRFLYLYLGLCCLLFTSACSNEQNEATATEVKKYVVSLLIYDETDVYLQSVTKAIVQNFGDKVTVLVAYATNDQPLQNTQIDHFITKKVDGLIVNLVDTNEIAIISEKAKKANVPVVFFNREPNLDIFKKYENTFFVGTITEDAGILQGDLIAQLWAENPSYDRNNDGIIQYIMIQAHPDSVEAVARTEYNTKQATKNGLKLQQVDATLMCEWNQKIAEEQVEQIWPLIRDQVELIISNNDTMALGAIKALQKNGYNLEEQGEPYIPVIGVDATKEAIMAIKKGVMAGTVKQNEQLMGETITKIMLNTIAGKPITQNPDLQWRADGRVVRIPYSIFSHCHLSHCQPGRCYKTRYCTTSCSIVEIINDKLS